MALTQHPLGSDLSKNKDGGNIYDKKWLIYATGKDGAWDEIHRERSDRRGIKFSDLIDFSHGHTSGNATAGTCRWGIKVVVTAPKLIESDKGNIYCDPHLKNKYGQKLVKLSKINWEKGYNFILTLNEEKSKNLIKGLVKSGQLKKDQAENMIKNMVEDRKYNSIAFELCAIEDIEKKMENKITILVSLILANI